jgi:hypothetical protein
MHGSGEPVRDLGLLGCSNTRSIWLFKKLLDSQSFVTD